MKTDPILLALGKNVSELRKEKGLTQEQLAEHIDRVFPPLDLSYCESAFGTSKRSEAAKVDL